MNIAQLLTILRARAKIVLLTLAVTVFTALAISLVLPKIYEATSTIVISYKGSDPVSGNVQSSAIMPGYMGTQVDIIRSKGVALGVVDALRLADNPVVREDFQKATDGQGNIREWLADLLLKKLTVTPARESNVVDITFQGSSPEFVAAVANTFASEHQKMTLQLKVQPLKQASQYFTSQIKGLRDNLEAAQGKLSKYQQEKGLVSVDNRLDVESSRLNDLSTQLVIVQGQLSDATSRRRQAQGAGANESPDIVSNPLVQNLKVSLAQAQAKLSEVGQRVYPNHPTYQAAKAEVDQLQAVLKKTIEQTSSSVGNSAEILQRREAEVKAALAAQKAKILELNRDRDELAVLMRDVDSAQRAYDTTMQRFSQTSLEGQSNQTDVAVLSQAMPPTAEVGPKIVLNVLLSIFVGLMLGFGAGLVSEMFDRRIRSESDLEDLQDTPIIRFADPNPTASLSRFSVGLLRRPATN